MAQKIMEDMNIKKPKVVLPPKVFDSPRIPEKTEIRNTPKNNSRYALWIVALVSIVFLFFGISSFFANAKITISPKSKDFVLNQDLSATKDSDSGMSYHLVGPLSGEESKQVAAGAEQDYLVPATGEVLLYNTFSAISQTLAKNTKLEGSNGKIYQTTDVVTIPGMAKDGTPGKISVGITATAPGEEYNSDPLDFKIAGFQGTKKYSKFYGRSVGSIAGGLNGKSRQVSDADKAQAVTDLTTALQDKLFKQAKNQTPKEFILFPDAGYLSVDDQTVGPVGTDGNATVTVSGTYYGFLFKQQDLSKSITDAVLDDTEKTDDVYIPNLADAKILLTDKTEALFTDATEISFNLSGTIKVVWKVDTDKIIADVLGKNKADFNQILSTYTNIDSANLSIKPVWKSSFPDESKRIKVIVNYPQ